ncbi:hypothetical protein PInf_026076 [Phytophthora infestans]|nr:hypothetical protein PInf_026076 [Phytophthora infestans]
MNRYKVLSNYPFVDGDIHWIKRRVLMFPAVCTTAGVAAGLLGIGGGMVKGPIMLETGVLPAVQSATASFMILFTASSTTLQFAINGQFPGEFQFDYMVWFAFVGFVGGFCGLKCVGYFVKKYKRESIMVYMLATTIGLSAVAMGAIGCEYCRPAAHECGDYIGDVAYTCHVVEVLDESTGETETQQGLTSTGDVAQAAYCVEKNLFAPFTYNDLLTTLIAFSCTALGAGGGIGGGGLLVPMYIFGGLNPKHAIPLSKVTIFGSAVAMYAVNFRRKHPLTKNRPLIDFGLVGLMEPTTLVGTVFGVMLNHIFPNWLILVLLVTLLSFIIYKTVLTPWFPEFMTANV